MGFSWYRKYNIELYISPFAYPEQSFPKRRNELRVWELSTWVLYQFERAAIG